MVKSKGYVFDHVVPLELGGDDEPYNMLLACTSCNGLRWDHHPETIRRILFLGVIANQLGYKNPSTSAASKSVRSMRAKRLADNAKRRRNLTSRESAKLLRRFNKFEDEIVRLLQDLKRERPAKKSAAKRPKVRWTEVVDTVLRDGDRAVPPRYRDAYKLLVSYEDPGPEEANISAQA